MDYDTTKVSSEVRTERFHPPSLPNSSAEKLATTLESSPAPATSRAPTSRESRSAKGGPPPRFRAAACALIASRLETSCRNSTNEEAHIPQAGRWIEPAIEVERNGGEPIRRGKLAHHPLLVFWRTLFPHTQHPSPL